MATAVQQRADLVIRRVFDATREHVWNAWTRPEEVKKWWGPKDFTAPHISMDPRPGGKYVFCMRGAGPDGVEKDYWSTGTYQEVVPLEKIVCTDSFADEKGKVVPATHYGMGADFPRELLVTVTYEDLGCKTRMTLRHEGLPEGNMKEMARQGWSTSFDKLAASLK